MIFKKRVHRLSIELDPGNGKPEKFNVEFYRNMFGRIKILDEKGLPPEVAGRYNGTLLAALLSKTDYKIVETPIGWRLTDKDGRVYQYEFTITLPDGTSGIPFANSPFNRLRRFLDMRNIGLSSRLDGATIQVKVNDAVLDLKDSSVEEITSVYHSVRIYNLDGSQSCAFISDASSPRQPYQKDERNYDQQQRWLYRHYFWSQPRLPAKGGMPLSKFGSWPVNNQIFAAGSFAAPARAKDGQELDPDFLPQDNAVGFSQHFMPMCDATPLAYGFPAMKQPVGLQDGEKTAAIPWQSEDLPRAKDKQHSGASPPENQNIRGNGGRGRAKSHGLSGGGEDSETKAPSFKPVPLSALKNFKAAIFDLDGVMVDSERAHLQTFNEAFAKFGIRIAPSFWKRNYTGIGSRAIVEDLFRKNGIREPVPSMVSQRAEIYQKYVEKNGLPAMPGAIRALALLQGSGIKAIVASGGHRSHIAASLDSIGVPNLEFVGHEDVARHKPSPDTFLLAAEKLGVKPSECIVFEDSLSGIRAAASAGMVCVALSTTLPASQLRGKAALVVKDFNSPKLRRLLSRLIAKGKKGKKGAQTAVHPLSGNKKPGRKMRKPVLLRLG